MLTEISKTTYGRISITISEDAERPMAYDIAYVDIPTKREIDRHVYLSPNPRVSPTDLEQAQQRAVERARELLANMTDIPTAHI